MSYVDPLLVRGYLFYRREAQWSALFRRIIQGGGLPDWLTGEKLGENPVAEATGGKPVLEVKVDSKDGKMPDLISPLRMDEKIGLFSSIPKMSTDSEDESEEMNVTKEWEVEVPGYVVTALRTLQRKVKKIEATWGATFQEVEMSYVDVIQDITKLQVFGKIFGGGARFCSRVR